MTAYVADYWHTAEDEADIDFYQLGTSMGYGKVISRLYDAVEADWAVETTGGGCLAIIAQLEGIRVYVTDFYDTLSTYPERRYRHRMNPYDGQGECGWAVGIYHRHDDYCETRGWADSRSDDADVAQLVLDALADYRRHAGAICIADCWGNDR